MAKPRGPAGPVQVGKSLRLPRSRVGKVPWHHNFRGCFKFKDCSSSLSESLWSFNYRSTDCSQIQRSVASILSPVFRCHIRVLCFAHSPFLSFRILVLLVVVFVLHARGDSASSARMPSSLSSVILLINRLLFGIFCVHFLSGFSAPSRHPSQGYLCAPGQLPSPWKTADTLGLRIVTG